MPYQVRDLNDELLDAHFEIDGNSIIFHSRGGSKGRGASNTQYGPGLRAILERLNDNGLAVSDAWVDSSNSKHLTLSERQILKGSIPTDPGKLFTELSRNMRSVGQSSGTSAGGNSTRRIRLQVEDGTPQNLAEALQGIPSDDSRRRDKRLPADLFSAVRADHIFHAIQRFKAEGAVGTRYKESISYDLIDEDGKALPPKAIFGLAASEALGFEVKPSDFSGGEGTACFRIIRESGYKIIPKSDDENETPDSVPTNGGTVPPSDEDQQWAEGEQNRVEHLRRERSRAAVKAKKSAFKAEHGRLFCEKCLLDPVIAYEGPEGESCIEAHHIVPLSESAGGREVRLEDLQLLCANCHRIVHRRMRKAAPTDK